MHPLEKKYKRFRRPQKPEKCRHCNGRRMVPRGDTWGCFDCGRWENEETGNQASRSPFGGWTADPRQS